MCTAIPARSRPRLALAGVYPDTHLHSESPDRLGDRDAAADRGRWTVERGEEPISGGADLPASVLTQFGTHDLVVIIEHVSPVAVPRFGSLCG